MKRSAGVTASAVATIIGAMICLLLAALMFIGLAFRGSQPGTPAFVRAGLILGGALMLVLSSWGIATGIGLFKLRPWSRTSILIFSGLLAAGCGMTALMVNIAPLPPPGNGPPEPGGTRIGITIFYGLLALLGGGWLYFFNSAKAKAQFTRPVAGSTSFGGARPLSVTIIGSFLLLSVAMFMILGFCAVPATFFGLLVIGLPGHLLYIGFGGIALWLGIGLLRLNPLARFVAVGYFTFLVLNGLLFVVLPGYTQRVNTSLAILPSELRPAQVGGYARSMAASMLTSVLINAIPIWFLLTGRDAFSRKASNPAAPDCTGVEKPL